MAPGNRKAPARAASSESTYSLMEFTRDFPDDETCLRWLWTTRYAPDGTHALCPRCDTERTFQRYETKQQRQSWTCTACSLHIHPTAGTIFHKSSTALHLWFYAMYLMTSTRCGISAKQLERELGVTYKTAWRMFTLIRNELMTQDDDPPLSGVVELDEMYVGGKPRAEDRREFAKAPNVRSAALKWSDQTKTQVFGAVERNRKQWIDGEPKPTITRHGKVTAHVIPSRRKPTLMGHVARRVDPEAVVYTDTAHAYDKLHQRHETVNHHDKVYVAGDVHTQTIDGFWSLVKRGISGTHHAVSPKWLQGYLNEYAWRYNHRDDGRAMFLTLLLRSSAVIGQDIN
jgi:transposase-like protein